MFGSTTPFGQSTNSPFGTPSVFGQTNNATNNPFAPKGFGSGSPFGSQTGTSMFGGTSTGVFGATPSSSSLASTPAFGASSPAFGSSAFGAASTPAFGTGSSSFGGSSVFGQKPAFGGFGSTPGQSNPFGSTFQQSQPAFGNSLFGSTTPFSASSTPAFGATSTPAFGATSTPAFGATSTPAFGSTSTPAFGSTPTPTFGSTGSVFGTSSTPAFGASSTPAFGVSSTPVFGSSSTPAFGATSTPAFGSSNTPAFGASSSTPSFTFGSSPAFGQSTAAFGSNTFGTTPFGSQSSPFGAQSTTPAFGSPGFGQQAFGGQRGGTRVVSYTPTSEVDGGSGTQPAGKLESIAAMPAYKDKSHEELRWEDYQLGDKGGPNPASQPASGIGFGAPAQSSPFGTSGTFGQPSANPFSSSTTSNPFAPKTQTFGSTGFGASSSPAFSSPFGVTSSSPFGSTTSSTTPSMFGPATTPAFGGTSTSLFGASSTPAFGASSSSLMFGSTSAGSSPAFGSGLNFSNTQASGLFQSSTPSLGQTSIFGSATPTFGQTTNSSFGQQNPFSTPSAGFGGNLFTSNSAPSLLNTSNPIGFGQTTLSLSSPFTAPAQTSGAFSFGNFGQIQPAASTGFGGVSNAFGQGNFGQLAPGQNNLVAQPMPVTNPFGTLPAMPQMSIGRAGSSPSIQYGISSMPVADKPAPIRISSLLTSRHLSQRRIRLPPRKYHPKNDGPKIPFFSDEEAAPSTPKADALFIPRENPRALVIRPMEQRPSRAPMEKQSHLKDASTPGKASGKDFAPALNGGSAPVLNGSVARDHQETNGFDGQENTAAAKLKQKPNGIHHEVHGGKGDSYITVSGHRAGEAAIVYEHGADIKVLMPKLRHADYFTEPPIQELAAKERVEPGYCRRVKDFVVGRHGYGSIRFFGETDVRSLDLESLLQFNNKEVIVYMDESKKPPVGQGLNKPAEVTLLNVKCFNKKTGQQYTEGPRMEKYKEMLIKKAEDQDAEFVSYDPVKGEWKFRVNHFSRYVFEGECWNDGDHISFVR